MSGTARALVTGASGFIGRWSVPALIAGGFEVHAVVSPRHAREALSELKGAILHRCDLLEGDALDALVEQVRPTHLLHFAWIAQPKVYWTSPDNFRWLEASLRLLRRFRAAGGQRVVMAGSCAEYDWSASGVFEERQGPFADSSAATTPAYTACKLKLERELAAFAAEHQLSSAWGRIFFQFGPHEHAQRLVPSVIVNLLDGREALCTHGRQVRGFLHAADVGAAFAAILTARIEGAVNVGSDERITLAELIERIAAKIGRPDLVRLGARTAPEEPPLIIPVTRRLRAEVGWQPRFNLDAGLTDTIAWWRAQTPAART